MTTGEEGELRRQDDGDARPHVCSFDHRRLPDEHAVDVGDRVARAGFETADSDAEVGSPHGAYGIARDAAIRK